LAPNYLENVLIGYGLTKNQSKVISCLINSKESLTAKRISVLTNLARESVYRSLLTLREMDLLEKTIDFPTKYRAIPIKSALYLLHEKKSMQIHELEALTTQVLLNYNQNINNRKVEKQANFILVPRKKQLLTKISSTISNSQNSVKVITSWKRHLKALITYKNALNQALTNNVTFQVLVTETPKNYQLPEEARSFHNHTNASVKFTNFPTKLIEVIVDNNEVFLMTEPKANLSMSPAL
jgi:sugar-specific transcriptional regulator TrmB